MKALRWIKRTLFGHYNKKKYKQLLEESNKKVSNLQERLNEIQKIADLAYWEYNLSEKRLICSKELHRIFELKPNSSILTHEDLLERVHPEDRESVRQIYRKSLKNESGYNIIHRLILRTGKVKYINEICKHEYNEEKIPIRSIATVQDITDRKLSAKALMESENRFQSLIQSLDDIVWAASADGKILYVNASIEKVFGKPANDFLKDPKLWSSMIHPEDRELVIKTFKHSSPNNQQKLEYRIIKENGEVRWLYDRKSIVVDSRGRRVRINGITTDITEQKRMKTTLEQTARDLEKRVQELTCLYQIGEIENMEDLTMEKLFLNTLKLIPKSLRYPNEAACRILFEGEIFAMERFDKNEQPLVTPITHHNKTIGTIESIYFQKPSLLKGEPFLKEEKKLLAEIGKRLGVIIERVKAEEYIRQMNQVLEERVRERTKELQQSVRLLKKTQEQLIIQEKLASMGALTTRIAHEIRNPLNFIKNFAELIEENMEEFDENMEKHESKLSENDWEELEEIAARLKQGGNIIRKHAVRADKIVHNMLIHNKKRRGNFQASDINNLLKDTILLACQETGFSPTNIHENYDKTVGVVHIVPQDMGRALLNILHNAIYELQKERKSPPLIEITTKNLNHQLSVQIRDNGQGISEEVLPDIFTPFYTTKPTGSGTGLGLSISYDIIVREHKGTLDVDTEKGEFTKFTILLPQNLPETPFPAQSGVR